METAKANSLRLDDDLLPWSEEMKSWFSAVYVLGTTAFLYRGIMIYTPNTGCPVLGVHITKIVTPLGFYI